MYNYFYYSNETTIVALPDYLNSTTIGDQFMFTYGSGYFTYLASLSGAIDLTFSITHEGYMCYNTNQNVYVALFRYSESTKAQLKVLTKESDFRPRCAPSTQILVRRRPPQPPLVSTTKSRPPWPSLVSTTQSRPQRSPLVSTTQPSVSTTQSRPPRSPLVSTTQSRPQRPPLNGFVHHDPLTKLP